MSALKEEWYSLNLKGFQSKLFTFDDSDIIKTWIWHSLCQGIPGGVQFPRETFKVLFYLFWFKWDWCCFYCSWDRFLTCRTVFKGPLPLILWQWMANWSSVASDKCRHSSRSTRSSPVQDWTKEKTPWSEIALQPAMSRVFRPPFVKRPRAWSAESVTFGHRAQWSSVNEVQLEMIFERPALEMEQ